MCAMRRLDATAAHLRPRRGAAAPAGADPPPRSAAGRVAGKVVAVVGAGQTEGETPGNGKAAAILFAREGASVLLVDRSEAAVRKTEAQIAAAGGSCRTLVADVADEAGCRAITDACLQHWGRIDVLHYNVGIGGPGDGNTLRLTQDGFARLFDVNIRGFWLCCKHCLPPMRKQGHGAIVAISSVAAVAGPGGGLAYKTSKAALNAAVQHVAIENARHGIRCNAIMPGLMDTPMAIEGNARARVAHKGGDLAAVRAQTRKARDARVPLATRGVHLQGTAWDVGNAALFLASDDAKFVTGVALPVDGGATARVG